jgi:purine-nucleoside phosphorylase
MREIEKVKEAADYLKKAGFTGAETGIILGTGLGAMLRDIEEEIVLSYDEIPHFPISTVEFHHGKLIKGKIFGKNILAMQGRFHYYEGYSMQEVVFPVRVMHTLGIKNLLISNAAGTMNLNWQKGELMLITDHINLQSENPLRGQDAKDFGPVFTDMSEPYDTTLNDLLLKAANKMEITLRKGVYVAVNGPNLETKAEYRYLKMIGADVVGMSTVPEVIAANQLGLSVSAVSVITDECDPENLEPINIQDILSTAAKAEKDMVKVFEAAIQNI